MKVNPQRYIEQPSYPTAKQLMNKKKAAAILLAAATAASMTACSKPWEVATSGVVAPPDYTVESLAGDVEVAGNEVAYTDETTDVDIAGGLTYSDETATIYYYRRSGELFVLDRTDVSTNGSGFEFGLKDSNNTIKISCGEASIYEGASEDEILTSSVEEKFITYEGNVIVISSDNTCWEINELDIVDIAGDVAYSEPELSGIVAAPEISSNPEE